MSKSPQESNQVYSFLQKSLANQREQGNAMEVMLDRMMVIEQSVNQTAAEIQVFAKEFRDINRLLPAEIDELYMAVVEKSTELAKIRHKEVEENFPKIVGKYRKNIWSKMKKKFGTSKYIHIKRIDFEPALSFVANFDPENYL
ncbi:ORF6C domain-containing protein [Paenibacillus jamilae]|uniref:ORF6C domain-containing protein n=1 Tax=Paenibacillus jamilae TaxID=114136 RepID=UPI003D275901